MIRGIILLILSFVVLTIQTHPAKPCTCAEHAGPTVHEHAANLFPVSDTSDYENLARINYEQYLQKIQKFHNDVSAPDYRATATTPTLLGLKASISLEDNELLEVLLRHEAVRRSLDRDILHINVQFGDLISDLLCVLPMINLPIPAVNHVTKLLSVLNRQEQLRLARSLLDVNIDLLGRLRSISLNRLDIVDNLLGVSRTIDGKLSRCSSTGGLLGGVLGGVLGNLVDPCSRKGILTSILDVGGLLNEVLQTVDQLLDGLAVNINLLTQTLNVNIAAGLLVDFSELTVHDHSDDVLRNNMFDYCGQLENMGCPSYSEVRERIGSIANDNIRLNELVGLININLAVFKASNSHFTCLPGDLISCNFRTVISHVDVDVDLLSLVSVNLELELFDSFELCSQALRVLLLATTGGSSFDVKVKTYDLVTGAVEIDISVSPEVHETMCVPYTTVDLHDETITETVTQTVTEIETEYEYETEIETEYEYETEVDVIGDSQSDYITAIDEQERLMNEQKEEFNTITEQRITVQEVLERAKTQRETCKTAITNAQPGLECTRITRDCFVTTEQARIDSLEAVRREFEAAIIQANEQVIASRKEFLQAELDRVNHLGDTTYELCYQRRRSALISALEEAATIKAQLELQVKDLTLALDVSIAELRALQVALDLNIEKLDLSLEVAVIDFIKIDLMINGPDVLGKLVSIISSIRPGCRILNLDSIFSLLSESSETISLDVLVGDVLQTGELVGDVTGLIANLIGGGFTSLEGALFTVDSVTDVVDGLVDGVVGGLLNPGETCYRYRVQCRGSQTQKRAISEEQIDVITETTSSSGPLAFSFIVLLAIMSFVFFK